MGAIVSIAAIVIATIALLVGDRAGAVGALAVGALALIAGMLQREWRRGTTTGGRGPRVTAHDEGWSSVENELRRERRNGRSLTLLRIVPHEGLPAIEAAQALNRSLRSADICFVSNDAVYVAMPEVGRAEAHQAAERLSRQLLTRGATCTIGSATYPEDALTVNGLLAGASEPCVIASEPTEIADTPWPEGAAT